MRYIALLGMLILMQKVKFFRPAMWSQAFLS